MNAALLYFSVVFLYLVVISICGVLIVMLNKLIDPSPKDRLLQQNHGIPLGGTFPDRSYQQVDGGQIDRLTGEAGGIVILTSPNCGACKVLYPVIRQFAGSYPRYTVTLLMFGNIHEVRETIMAHQIDLPVGIIDQADLQAVQTSFFPFAYRIDADRQVLSKGIVLNQEHLDILLRPAASNGKRSLLRIFSPSKRVYR